MIDSSRVSKRGRRFFQQSRTKNSKSLSKFSRKTWRWIPSQCSYKIQINPIITGGNLPRKPPSRTAQTEYKF
jgi:hypothetical protein